MDYENFLNLVIERGIAAATRDYGDKSPNKLKGSVDGFNACRGLRSPQLLDLLTKARERANQAMYNNEPIDLYWELRCYEAEVEWVCNCVSIVLTNEGREPIIPPTARAAMTVAEILGVNNVGTPS